MRIEGQEIFASPREAVWRGLNDPDTLKRCIPGCESFTRESPSFLKARIVARMGLIKITVTGSVTQSAISPPESCHLLAQGEGGIAGFAAADADIRLSALGPSQCQLDYQMEARIGGALARFGTPLISSVVKSAASRFFARLAADIASQP